MLMAIYPLVQNVYRTDLFNVDGLIYPLCAEHIFLLYNISRTEPIFNVDGLIYPLVMA